MVFKQARRSLSGHPLRTFFTALSVVLGVAFVVGAFVLGDMITKAFDDIFETANRGTDVRVESLEPEEGRDLPQRFDAALLEQVQAVPGVDQAVGSLFLDQVVIIDSDGEAMGGHGPPQFGASWVDVEQLNSFTVVEGSAPTGPDQVVIDTESLEKSGYEIGDRIRVAADGPAEEFTLVGSIEFGSGLGGATFAVWDLARASELFGAEGQLRFITVRAAADVSPGVLRDRIADVLPEGVQALTGEEAIAQDSGDIQAGVSIFRNLLLGFAAVALLVAVFVIFNVFAITVAQRTRQFGLLRVVGSSPAQIRWIVVVEGLLIGILASALGVVAGLGVAAGLTALFDAVGISLPTAGLTLEPRTVYWAVGVGLVTTLIASLIPAIRASRISPIEAMREAGAEESRVSTRARVFGIALPALGIALIAWGLWGSLDLEPRIAVMAIGALLLFVGAAVGTMMIVGPLVAVLGAPARALSGVSGRLASENVVRKPGRTAASAAALTIGVALVAFFAIFTSSLKDSLDRVLEEQFRADYVAFVDGDENAPFSPEFANRLDAAPEIGTVTRWRHGAFSDRVASGEDPDYDKELFGVEADKLLRIYDPDLVAGEVRFLVGQAIMMHESAADDRGIGVGDSVELLFVDRPDPVSFRLVATYADTTWGDYMIPLDTYGNYYAQQGDTVVLARAAEGVETDAADAAFETVSGDFPQVSAWTNQEFRDAQSDQLDQLLGLIYAMLALAIIIAVLGIIATLFLAVHERTREIGLLRAVGLGRGQTGVMVLWESIMTALVGSLVGIVIGIALAILIVERLSDDIPVLSVPVGQLVLVLMIAAVVGVLAALLPAWRAARTNILEAIHSE